MKNEIKCEQCLCLLEFEIDGQRMEFTKHTHESCAATAGQLRRVQLSSLRLLQYEHALLQQRLLKEEGAHRKLKEVLVCIEGVLRSDDEGGVAFVLDRIGKIEGLRR